MSPNILGEEEYDSLRIAITPSSAEIISIRQAVLVHLSSGDAASSSDLRTAALTALEVPPEPSPQELYEVAASAGSPASIDPEAGPVKRQRIAFGINLALAELVAEGLISVAEGPDNVTVNVPIRRGGHSGAERIPVARPKAESAYVLTPGRSQFAVAALVDHMAYAQDFANLLGPRGMRCLDEALRAARRGLFLSAINLLGAVSEAAWYSIGDRFRESDSDLASALGDGQTANVQRLVADRLAAVRRQRSTVSELRAHAAYLRDLRNYGVHPGGDHDSSLEDAFTETGCLLLLMETRRYLARLSDAADAVTESN